MVVTVFFTHLLLNLVTRLVSFTKQPSNSYLAGWLPWIKALHLLFSQQSQYAVGEVRFNLQSCPRWHTFAHSVQQQREPVKPHVRHSKISYRKKKFILGFSSKWVSNPVLFFRVRNKKEGISKNKNTSEMKDFLII